MNSPRLTDFESEELRQLLRVVLGAQMDLQSHIKYITGSQCDELLQDAVMDCNARIETLELWATQLAQAIVTKEKENLVNLN